MPSVPHESAGASGETAEPKRATRRFIAGAVLLVALLLVLWLASMDPFPKHQFQKRKHASHFMASQVDRGLRRFYLEYSSWPAPLNSELASNGLLRTDPLLTGILLGNGRGNPKKIKFLPDFRVATEPGQFGLKPQPSGGTSLVDAYGEELYVIVEGAGAVGVDVPGALASEEGINQSVGVYSAGPDKDPSTWEDNLASWQINASDR